MSPTPRPLLADDPTSYSGVSLDGFELGEPVVRLPTGWVFRGRQLDLDRTVRLKLLPSALAGSATWRERFRRELAVLRTLRHPGLPQLLAGDPDGEPPWYATEWIEGETLDRLIGSGKPAWPRSETERLARELLASLEILHRAGLVVRDLSPQVVMHDAAGRFRLVDFGLVHGEDWDRITSQGDARGATRLVPPEVLAGKPSDVRGDLYLLGILLHAAASGTPAQVGNALPGSTLRPLLPPPPLPDRPDQPGSLSGFLARLTAPDPGARPVDAASALAALDALVGEGREHPPDPGPMTPTPGHAPGGLPLPQALAILACVAVASAWFLGGAPFPGEQVQGLSVATGPSSLALEWRTGRPVPSTLRLVPEDGTPPVVIESRRPTRHHRLATLLPGTTAWAWSILDPRGGIRAEGIHRPSPRPGNVISKNLAYLSGSRRALAVESPDEVEARLVVLYPDGERKAASPERARSHTLELAGIPVAASCLEARLSLHHATGEVREILLDPRSFHGARGLREHLVGRIRDRYLPLLADLFHQQRLRVGQGSFLLEAMDSSGIDLDPLLEPALVSDLLADPASPLGEREDFAREISRLGDFESLLWYMETEREPRLVRLLDGWSRVARRDALPAAGGPVRELALPRVALLPQGIVSGYSRLLQGIGLQTRSAVTTRLELDEKELAGAREVTLAFSFGNLHPGAIVDVFVGTRFATSLRRPGSYRFGTNAEEPRARASRDGAVHLEATLPAGLLANGERRLRLEPRPPHGIPLGEATSLLGARIVLR